MVFMKVINTKMNSSDAERMYLALDMCVQTSAGTALKKLRNAEETLADAAMFNIITKSPGMLAVLAGVTTKLATNGGKPYRIDLDYLQRVGVVPSWVEEGALDIDVFVACLRRMGYPVVATPTFGELTYTRLFTTLFNVGVVYQKKTPTNPPQEA